MKERAEGKSERKREREEGQKREKPKETYHAEFKPANREERKKKTLAYLKLEKPEFRKIDKNKLKEPRKGKKNE